MDIFILTFTFLADLLLGLVVFLRNKKGKVEITFALMSFFISVWIVSNYMTNDPLNGSLFVSDISNRIAFASALLFIASAAWLTYVFPVLRKPAKSEALFVSITALFVAALSLTDLVAGRVYYSHGQLQFTIGSLLWLFALEFLFLVAVVSRNLLFLKGRVDQRVRKQARFVMFAISGSAVGGLILNVAIPSFAGNWHTTKYGPLVTVILVAFIAYSIVKHRLFDVKFAAVRTIAYGCVLLTLSAVYYLCAYVLSIFVFSGQVTENVSVSPVNILLALLLAFLFQPIKQFFDRITNDIFFRESYRSEDFFASLSTLLTSTTDLRGLLVRASHEMAATFKAEQVFFFLHYTNAIDHHMSAGTAGHAVLPIADSKQLDTYTMMTTDTVFVTEIMGDDDIRRMLRSHKIALVVPLRQGEKISGYVMLGDHLTSNYTKRDLNVLSTIGNELVIAIQNALSLHEVQELNATLQQRIDVATKELRSSNAQLKHLDEVKDEFMSMASHQLRTPLTSVKGYISMVLEGDAGKITSQQHKLLVEAFKSSERMVGLIADFLNVSRLQTGKFIIEKAAFDLRQVVQQEVDDLQLIATSHDIKLRAKLATGEFPVLADEQKLRQVIMNFIDNAIYYSHPNSTIIINLEKVASSAALTVVDTGIGVPEGEQAHLFTKFFRAKNARKQRPDGTGVGLYLARRVITAHGGSMIFSSKEGKGSTFGFRLPLEKPASPIPSETHQ